MANRTKWTPEKRAAFLASLADGDTAGHAARTIGLGRSRAYELRAEDATFAADWDMAVKEGLEMIEQEVKRRAADGYDEPVHYQGQRVDVVRRYSDTLLMFLLKGRDPDRWRERQQIEHTGNPDRPMVFVIRQPAT